MSTLPAVIDFFFVLTVLLTVALFLRAVPRPGLALPLLSSWLLVQSALAISGFYTIVSTLPPRLALLAGPPLLLLMVPLLLTARGRNWLDGLSLPRLTLLHAVRIPVELLLFGLYVCGTVPRLMTFEGRNWDIIAGLSAPVVCYLVFRRQSLGRTGLLLWNLAGLGLLLNIVALAALSLPSPLQQMGFEQPNVAILHFPFALLPGLVVPLVLLAHVAAIRRLLGQAKPQVAALTV